MTSRTERWRASVRPGSPGPAPRILRPEPPPFISPDCSISNVGVSPPRRPRSFSASSPQPQPHTPHTHNHNHTTPPRHRSPPPKQQIQDSAAYHHTYHSPSPRTPSPYSSSTQRNPVPPLYNPAHHQPRVRSPADHHLSSSRDSRSSRQETRPGLYVIQPRNGPNGNVVQALYPQRSDSAPPTRTSNHYHHHHRSHYSPTSEKSLFRRVLDKFGNKDKENLHTRTRSSSAYPNKHLVQSSSINRPRRNSTGSSSDQWHIVPGEPQYAFTTSRTSRKGTVYQVI